MPFVNIQLWFKAATQVIGLNVERLAIRDCWAPWREDSAVYGTGGHKNGHVITRMPVVGGGCWV